MMIHLTLEEGGNWWLVDVHNADNLKHILNTGRWHDTRIYAVMFNVNSVPMIYDFALRQWR